MTKNNKAEAVVVVAGPDSDLVAEACDLVRSEGWSLERARTPDELLAPDSPSPCGLRHRDADAVVICEDEDSQDDWKPVARLARAERLAPVLLAYSNGAAPHSAHGLYLATSADDLAEAIRSRVQDRRASDTLRFSLADFLAAEVARARRLETPVSVVCLSIASAAGRPTLLEPQWQSELSSRVKRALRETDAQAGSSDGITVILPFTPPEALATVETRLHDSVRPMLRKMSSETGCELRLCAGSCSFPAEARDWSELLEVAVSRSRAEAAAGGEQAA